jgi:hypothetical protein
MSWASWALALLVRTYPADPCARWLEAALWAGSIPALRWQFCIPLPSIGLRMRQRGAGAASRAGFALWRGHAAV